eukprot:XP_022265516.1 dual specificity phosphatase 28 [Canis lupus familiaris]
MRPGPAGRDLPGAASPAPPPFARVAPSLFLGSARAAASPALLARAGVTLCVNVSRLQPGPAAPGVAELRVPVLDDPAEDLLVGLASGGGAGDGLPSGAEGAPCGAAFSLRLCTQAVKSARPVAEPNPGFWSQLQQYEATLQSLPQPSPTGEPSGQGSRTGDEPQSEP